MLRVLKVCRFLLLPLFLLATAGCGKGYKFAAVSGRVTLDNHPLAGAEVSFFPADGDKDAPHARGRTDIQGNYKLETFVGNSMAEGALVGENRVTITSPSTQSGKRPQTRAMAQAPADVPAKYNSQSKLTYTVPPDGTSEANFDLTSR